MKRSAILLFAFSFAVWCAFVMAQNSSEQSPSANSGIEGVILIGPTHGGPVRSGVPNSKPLPNTKFIVATEKGEVASFTTDEGGRFRVVVSPGHYKVSMAAGSKIGFHGPFEVDVGANQMTKVQWQCDSGMR